MKHEETEMYESPIIEFRIEKDRYITLRFAYLLREHETLTVVNLLANPKQGDSKLS